MEIAILIFDITRLIVALGVIAYGCKLWRDIHKLEKDAKSVYFVEVVDFDGRLGSLYVSAKNFTKVCEKVQVLPDVQKIQSIEFYGVKYFTSNIIDWSWDLAKGDAVYVC